MEEKEKIGSEDAELGFSGETRGLDKRVESEVVSEEELGEDR